jgi:hypothetical protein
LGKCRQQIHFIDNFNMTNLFTLLRTTRSNLLKAIEGLSIEQLNTVPNGFSNSIGWNFVHCLVTQQILCYKLSGLPTVFSAELMEHFKKGSSGKAPLTDEALQQFKAISIPLVDQLEIDYTNHSFRDFSSYETSYNFKLQTIEDAIVMNSTHEALHLGYVMAMKHCLTST